MRITHEIARQPADGKGLKLPILVGSLLQARRQLGLLIVRKDSNDRDKRVGKFRVVPAVLVRKRNDEIAIVGIRALAQAGRDLGFDPIYNLRVKRVIVM